MARALSCPPGCEPKDEMRATMSGRSGGTQDRRRDRHRVWRWQRRLLLTLLVGLSMALFLFVPVGPASRLIPAASAHALPVRSDPPANAILRTPPSRVRIWFDDTLVPATSHLTVVNVQGQQVDRRDSTVNSADPHELSVNLPPLSPGTYTVVWVVQSTDDGHVTEGSFVFSVAQANGTVPPPPSGHAPGSSSTVSSATTLTGPDILLTLATWLALLSLTCWLGGLIWETWILSPGAPGDPDLAGAAVAAARRFRRVAPFLLGGLLLADIAFVISQAAALAGDWAGAFAPSLWQAMLFGSRFGLFWGMRQVGALAALGLTLASSRRGWPLWRPPKTQAPGKLPMELAASSASQQAIPTWRSAVLEMLRGVPHVPRQLVAGWRRRSWLGRGELALGAMLLVAYALSGHAASVPSAELGYSLAVDLLHLVGNAAWVGGLLYIGFVLLPALYRLDERQHARVFALGLPQFSAVAIISAVMLAITGPLNASIHLTSLPQVVTTLYGRVLVVKSEFFLLMVAMSVYHAFSLRPRLTRALTQPQGVTAKTPDYTLVKAASPRPAGPDMLEAAREDEGISEQAWRLAERMETWLRREAMLGAAVLLCVALLGTFAGTLVPS
jgi:copper transport protein